MTEVAKIQPEALPADPMISMIERVVMDPNMPIERLERMLALRDKVDAQEAAKSFNAAFAIASAAFPDIPKRGRGNNGSYAKLEDIIRHTRPILSANGLALSFDTQVGEQVVVTAILAHVDGHSRQTSIALPRDNSGSKNTVQAVGSSQTYGQRYTAQAVLGLSLGDDTEDDGRGATATISEARYNDLRKLMDEAKADETRFLKAYGISNLSDLPAGRFDHAIAQLRRKIADNA